ncbi:MAG: DUF1800 domain-containing protein [Phormidesmis sp.]
MDSASTVTHVLNRLSFGPRPGDRAQIERSGIKAYIQQQLTPEHLADPPALKRRLQRFPALQLSPVELFEQYAPPPKASAEQRQNARSRQVQMLNESVQARLLRALESPRQLYEMMVDFWFNHFNVFVGKGLTMVWAGDYEQSAIRPHALGKFRALLGATAKHPAMLFYLDNWRNTDPNSNAAKGAFSGFNENYARELLELHTLGIDGGYSQADVENLTRIFTGWTMLHHGQRARDQSGFMFVANRHDPGSKVLLDKAIAPGGLNEGEAALDLLAQHPATARHLSRKLAQYFVADNPPESLVETLAKTFLASGGDIRSVLSALFESAEFWDPAYYQRKFKTPYQYLLSMTRAVGLVSPTEERLKRLNGAMTQLGMPLYYCRTPDGYAQVEAPWLSPDAMLRRVNFALATVNLYSQPNAQPPTGPSRGALAATLLEAVGQQLSAETQRVVNDSPVYLRPALILGSPEMMYR